MYKTQSFAYFPTLVKKTKNQKLVTWFFVVILDKWNCLKRKGWVIMYKSIVNRLMKSIEFLQRIQVQEL